VIIDNQIWPPSKYGALVLSIRQPPSHSGIFKTPFDGHVKFSVFISKFGADFGPNPARISFFGQVRPFRNRHFFKMNYFNWLRKINPSKKN
jgi:hypothetical protein